MTRKSSKVGAEYSSWYAADDTLLPDIPKIPPVKEAESSEVKKNA